MFEPALTMTKLWYLLRDIFSARGNRSIIYGFFHYMVMPVSRKYQTKKNRITKDT